MHLQIETLLSKRGKEYYFSFDGRNFGRGLVSGDKNADHIIKTNSFTCWKITDDILEVSPESQNGILFSANTFLLQWNFEYSIIASGEVKFGTIFYHWKGFHASKGLSPLPPNFEDNSSIVERICQWGEPPTFFHIFPKSSVVLEGQKNDFDANVPHLFIVRGELKEEMHMYEVPFVKSSLRSGAVFLAVVPSERTIFIWWGASVPLESKSLLEGLKLDDILKTVDGTWTNLETKKLIEGQEDSFIADDSSYLHINRVISSTPRLFYCNAITGEFSLTEVEYPLSSARYTAAFPFLQSHLYSADQPAVFLLLNQSDIWIWRAPGNAADKDFSELVQLVELTAAEYVKRAKLADETSIAVRFAEAGSEPLEFTNIFPYWMRKT